MIPSLYIAGRYLFSPKKRNAINIISGIAVLAFAVCTSALIIILSTMNGFEELIFSMYGKFNPDIRITAAEGKTFDGQGLSSKISSLKGVKHVFSVYEDNAAIRNGDYQTVCTVKGVDSTYFGLNGLTSLITEGEAVIRENGIGYMILGAGIDQKINAQIGGPYGLISLITPRRGDFSTADADAIRSLEIEPSGVVTLDETISNRYVFVPIGFARDLFEREGSVTSLEVRVSDPALAEEVLDEVKKICGNQFIVKNRYEQQASLYKMFRSEKWASFAILTFILLIAAFNALGSLTMLVMEKKNDIITLSSMGARPSLIRNIFFINGFMIAALGTVAGLASGIALVMLQLRYGLVKMQGAIIENYPVKLEWGDVTLVALTALGLGVITGLYPAFRSGKFSLRGK